MPSILVAPSGESAAVRRKKWTREECAQLGGVLELGHYELIDGELIEKMGKDHPHVRAMLLLLEWLRSVFPSRRIGHEMAIDVSADDNLFSEAEPDVVVLDRSILDLVPRPQAANVLLVVEVSDTTLAFDLNQKAALYARAGIAEYWVLDVVGRRLIVHRRPVDGAFREVMAYAELESIAPLAAPDAAVRVGDLL